MRLAYHKGRTADGHALHLELPELFARVRQIAEAKAKLADAK
jgi:hypothetical protein